MHRNLQTMQQSSRQTSHTYTHEISSIEMIFVDCSQQVRKTDEVSTPLLQSERNSKYKIVKRPERSLMYTDILSRISNRSTVFKGTGNVDSLQTVPSCFFPGRERHRTSD